jgi:predicted ribosome quality control (RQC) complex YloA/Tae2 family protein
MQTALHIRAVVRQLERELVGGQIVSTEFYKKERAAYLFVKAAKSRQSLGFVYHPHGAGVFVVPASKVHLDTREKPWPVFKLEGATITNVRQLELDRIFVMHLERDSSRWELVCEAIGPNGNLWLLDEAGEIQATLRKRDFTPGQPYTPAELPSKLNPLTTDLSTFTSEWKQGEHSSLVAFLDRRVLGLNTTLARELVTRADLAFASPDEMHEADIIQLYETMVDLVERFDQPESGYLYAMPRGLEAYPFKLKSAESDPEKFKTLSLAMQASVERRQQHVEERDERKIVTQAVSRAVKRLKRRLANIESDLQKAADYERYKKLGELLQINFDKIEKGMASIELEDAYLPGQTLVIKLDPAASAAENVQRYFRRYRKGREGLELLQRRVQITRDELDELEQIQAALLTDYERATQQYAAELDNLLPKEGVKREQAPRLPYREYTLSTGLTIFVGRDGTDNDRTTFEYARPYETWLHTQQCPGSHVVIKHPNKKFEPSKQEIAEAAAIAAWFSKARNDTLVPVVYTERRYVRKPRKAKPGLVTVEREKSVMVEPREPTRGGNPSGQA